MFGRKKTETREAHGLTLTHRTKELSAKKLHKAGVKAAKSRRSHGPEHGQCRQIKAEYLTNLGEILEQFTKETTPLSEKGAETQAAIKAASKELELLREQGPDITGRPGPAGETADQRAQVNHRQKCSALERQILRHEQELELLNAKFQSAQKVAETRAITVLSWAKDLEADYVAGFDEATRQLQNPLVNDRPSIDWDARELTEQRAAITNHGASSGLTAIGSGEAPNRSSAPHAVTSANSSEDIVDVRDVHVSSETGDQT